MKGISTILALILIVIIVVALVGLTYTFAIGIWGTATGGAEEQVEETTERMGKSITVVGSSCTNTTATNNVIKFTIKHTGTVDIESEDLTALLDGTQITTTPDIAAQTLSSGAVSVEFTYTATSQQASRELTISAPAADVDEALTCPA